MKKYTSILIVIVALFATLGFQTKPISDKKPKIIYKGSTFLSGGNFGNGKIAVKDFLSLMNLPLVSKDSLGGVHKVVSYSFTYAERGAYEDSTGKLRIMTDYFTAESENGKLPDYYYNNMKDRIKYGDTVYYSNIQATFTDTGAVKFHSLPIKLILTK